MTITLTEETLSKLQSNLQTKEMIIIKFTADWCGPCQGIKNYVDDIVKTLPNSIQFHEIDIDESLELYIKFKNKKMVTGIPAILGFKDGKKDHWYIPDLSVLGGDKKEIKLFFENCMSYVSN